MLSVMFFFSIFFSKCYKINWNASFFAMRTHFPWLNRTVWYMVLWHICIGRAYIYQTKTLFLSLCLCLEISNHDFSSCDLRHYIWCSKKIKQEITRKRAEQKQKVDRNEIRLGGILCALSWIWQPICYKSNILHFYSTHFGPQSGYLPSVTTSDVVHLFMFLFSARNVAQVFVVREHKNYVWSLWFLYPETFSATITDCFCCAID